MTQPVPERDLPESVYFTLHPLTEGVYAALARNRAAAGNAALVDLGGETLILDTFMTPHAARDLFAAAQRLTRNPVRFVVNSHWHPDHVLGNSVFPADAAIVATTKTRALIAEQLPARIRAFRQQRQDLSRELLALQEQARKATDEAERDALATQIRVYSALIEAADQLALRLPDWTFEQHVTLHGEKRQVEVITFGGGHTASDAIVWLPQERIVLVADLWFNGMHPWAGDGDPTAWQRIMDEIAALGPQTVVPGHGPVGTLDAFLAFKPYLEVLEATVRDRVLRYPAPVEGQDPLADLTIPAPFADLDNPERYARNVRALYDRLVKPRHNGDRSA
ncbi:MAG: hypothetical protein Kow0077_12860 [Anaerolineae bacterium]